MASERVIGPDVSFWMDDIETPGGIDFQRMKDSGAAFVIIRAGQKNWKDTEFDRSWANAKAAGLPRGSYWFYDSRAEPKSQARLWASILNGDLGELPLFADFEEYYGGSYGGWKNFYTFLEELKVQMPGKEIAIYTAYYYWRDHAPAPGPQLEYFHQYPLWIANYGVESPKVPAPWGADEWLFWQFTETGPGRTYGTESNAVDLNYFNGTLEELENLYTPVPDPDPDPDPEPPTDVIFEGYVNVGDGLRLMERSSPMIGADNIVARLQNRTPVRGTEVVDGIDNIYHWLHLVNGNYVAWEFLKTGDPPSAEPLLKGIVYAPGSHLMVRRDPFVADNIVRRLNDGDRVEGTEIEEGANGQYKWLHLTDGNYAAVRSVDGYRTFIYLDTEEPWYWVNPDWLTHYFGFKRRKIGNAGGTPCVFRIGRYSNTRKSRYAPMTPPWQLFMFDLLSLGMYGVKARDLNPSQRQWLAGKFGQLYDGHRAFTNDTGVDKLANYVSGLNLNKRPAEFHPMICGTVSIRGSEIGDKLQVYAFNVNDDPPEATMELMLTDPRIFFATIINKWGDYRVYNFPQLNEKPVPIPILTVEPCYYPLNELTKYTGPRRRHGYP